MYVWIYVTAFASLIQLRQRKVNGQIVLSGKMNFTGEDENKGKWARELILKMALKKRFGPLMTLSAGKRVLHDSSAPLEQSDLMDVMRCYF